MNMVCRRDGEIMAEKPHQALISGTDRLEVHSRPDFPEDLQRRTQQNACSVPGSVHAADVLALDTVE